MLRLADFVEWLGHAAAMPFYWLAELMRRLGKGGGPVSTAKAVWCWIVRLVYGYSPRRIPRPGPIHFVTQEEKMMLIVQGTLPPPGAADVAQREITINVTLADGTVLDPVTITKGIAESVFTFAAPRNATITTSQVDVDGDGNRSAPTLSGPFEAADTFPPPAPGQIGFSVVGQED